MNFFHTHGRLFTRSSLQVSVLCAITLPIAACKKPEKPKMPPPTVLVTPVASQTVPITSTFIGNLAPVVNAQIRSQITGYLLEQKYKDGEDVKKGDILFQIDPRPFQATLDGAQGDLAQAQANFVKADLNAQRAQQLINTKVISQQQYDDTIQAYQAAKAARDAAQASVAQAQINLSFCQITSPVDGTAAISTAQVGDLLSPSSGVLTTVVTVDPLKIDFTISEQDYLSYVQPFFSDPTAFKKRGADLVFDLILADGSLYPQKGSFYAINNQVNINTGTIQIEGRVANPAGLLRPGQFSRVNAVTHVINNAMVVPQQAVIDMQGTAQLAVVGKDNVVAVKNVILGPVSGELQVITSGVNVGDSIVVEGIQKARNGITVNPKPFAPPATGTTTGTPKP